MNEDRVAIVFSRRKIDMSNCPTIKHAPTDSTQSYVNSCTI